MPPVGFEPTLSAGERLQTYALNRAATNTNKQCGRFIHMTPNDAKILNQYRVNIFKDS